MPLSSTFVLSSSRPQAALKPGSAVDQIFENFDSFSERVALLDEASGRSYSFRCLKRLTGQVASGLAKRGFGRGHVMSLFGANCIENAPIAFGAMAAGGAIHLVKPLASKDELRFHFNLVQPKVIVTTAGVASSVLEAVQSLENKFVDIYIIGGVVGNCRPAEKLLDDPGDANPWGRVEINPEEDVALMIQTGGTTGMSKTPVLSHASLKLAVTEFACLDPKAPDQEKSLGYIPFNYALSFILLYGGWLRLGCAVVNVATSLDQASHLRLIEKHRITRMGVTPAYLATLLACPEFSQTDLSSVVAVRCGGAPMNAEVESQFVKAFLKSAPNAIFHQCYGMTEMCGGVITFPPVSHPNYKIKFGSVGIPRPGVELQIVSYDEERRPCGPNEMGIILIRSARKMKGYFGNEEATKKVMLDEGWYNSGDYGYFDEDDYVFLVDRVDELIRHKEGLVFPIHVESVLRMHPGVRDCAVIGRNCAEGGQVVAAFVVRTKACDVTEEELKTFIASHLTPREHLRGGVQFIDRLPKLPSGKIVRTALKQQLENL